MKELILKFIKEIFGVAAFEVGKYFFILIFGLIFSFFTSSLLTNIFSILKPYKIYISLLFIMLIMSLILIVIKRINKKRANFNPLEVEYKFIEHEIYQEYKDKNNYTYKRRYIIKALKNGLQTFHDKYHYTGKGKVILTSGIADHELYLTFSKGIWQFYEIRFNKTLSKGEEIEVIMLWEISEPKNKPPHSCSATIHHPTDKLIIKLKMPIELGVTKVTRELSADIGIEKPFDSEIVPLDEKGETSWVIKNPKLLHYYEVKWNFNI